MKDLLVLLAHLLTSIATLLGPGGARAVVADSLLMKQQLLIINRTRRRAPTLTALDRFLLGFWSLFLRACETIDGRREGVDWRARQGARREYTGVWRAK